MKYRFLIILACCMPALAFAANPWESFATPAAQEPEPVGGYTNGCLLGGQALKPEGKGYQVVRLSRQRNYGHPQLVSFIEELGKKVADNDLGLILVADMAMPRGGPFTSGHRSHQTGLDADIWLPLDFKREKGNRDNLESIVMVDHERFSVDPEHWSDTQAKLIQLAATDSRVARIFVHPAIKVALCQSKWQDRSWLNKIRPWWGHDSHFHVRLKCPAESLDCKPQDMPPPGDGCGAELISWYPEHQQKKPIQATPKPTPPLPMACQTLVQQEK